MSMEIPSALIRKIQVGLRKKAGVPSYDSTDQSLPPLPSFHDALSKAAAEDPSVPSYLRCNRCNRRLLGGIRSTLCIFCGQEHRREGFSHSVSFTSTTAYRNLLQSLGLNGSEAINLDAESNDSTKSQDTPNSGLVLSNLLSLELRWPSQKEEIANSDTNKDPVSTPAVNLSGVDLDSYFSDSRNETASRNMSNLNQTGTEASSKDHIFGTKFVDQQDMEFASFVHSDSSGGLGRQKSSSEVNEVSASFSSINEFHSTKDINDDNSWESWQDFTGSKEALGGFSNSWTTGTGATSIEPASGMTSVEPQDMEFGSFSQSHPFSEVGGRDGSKKAVTIEIDGLISTSNTEGCINTETMKDNSYPFEDWHFLTSSNEAPGGLSNLSTQTGTETTSHEATGGLSNLLTQTGRTSALNEGASVVKSVDLQDTESSSSLPSDYFSGALDGKKGSIEVNTTKFDASIYRNRISGTDEERVVSSTVQGAPMSDEYSNDSDLETSNSKIEKLLSDMPNLSFMLDSNLSIPKKVDGSYLNS
ncbi:uncharacterized protein M6B38_204510 [Iris pallida]|uniref:DUF7815 domain-containing protein n=1 Tax=Iris pallida TaxID=29817 RepID=A0AAX6E6V7_IRIPA|nr:uncharacterized protein M6B38_204510 [Iris pallida]